MLSIYKCCDVLVCAVHICIICDTGIHVRVWATYYNENRKRVITKKVDEAVRARFGFGILKPIPLHFEFDNNRALLSSSS